MRVAHPAIIGVAALLLLAVGTVPLTIGTAGPSDTTLHIEGERMTLHAGPGASIVGTTDLPPGTEVSIRLRSMSSSHPFLMTDSATVDRSGRFLSVVDLTDVPPGTNFSVVVHHDGTRLVEANGTVVECAGACADGPTGETTLPVESEPMMVKSATGVAIDGHANVTAGSSLSVRIRSSSGGSPFLMSASATVTQSGRFRTVLDFSSAEPGARFTLSIRHDGTVLLERTGVVVRCLDCSHSSDTIESITGDTPAVPNPTAQLGDVTRLPIGVGNHSTATLVFGSNRTNYVLNTTIRDGDGDGIVTLRFDTTAAGHPNRTPVPVTVANDADSVTVISESRINASKGGLTNEVYPITLRATNGTQLDRGSFFIAEPVGGRSGEGPQSRPDFGLTKKTVVTPRGQVVALTVGLGDADTATLVVHDGDEPTNYTATVTLQDTSDDGQVRVLLDTTAVENGNGPAWRVANNSDNVSVDATTSGTIADTGVLSVGDYSLTLYRGANATGEPADIGTLFVQESRIGNGSSAGDTGTNQPVLSIGGLSAIAVGGILAIIGFAVLTRGIRRQY